LAKLKIIYINWKTLALLCLFAFLASFLARKTFLFYVLFGQEAATNKNIYLAIPSVIFTMKSRQMAWVNPLKFGNFSPTFLANSHYLQTKSLQMWKATPLEGN